MKTLVALVFTFLLIIPPSFGQTSFNQPQLVTRTITTSATTCTTASCAYFVVPADTGAVTVQVTGTFTGATFQFETSIDGNTTPVAITGLPIGAVSSSSLASSTTTTGIWQFAMGGLPYLQVRASALSTGSAIVYIQSSKATGPKF